jgi:RHS repeat-associated protein
LLGEAAVASYVLDGTDLLSQTRSGATSYYLQDAQGSTRTLTDASGNVTDTYAYTAFGETLSHNGASVNPYLYTGQQFDAASGLYYLRARYYDPALGRFLSRDVYPYALDNLLELNRYLYGLDNPVNALDPTGRQAFVEYSELNESAEERAQPIAATIQKTNLELAQESGAWGEEAFAEAHPGFIRHKLFETDQGLRIVDFYDEVNRIAYEIKTGYQSLSSTISQEIAKDVELLARGRVEKVMWYFYRSPINGSIGGSRPLLDLLAQEGIIVEILP